MQRVKMPLNFQVTMSAVGRAVGLLSQGVDRRLARFPCDGYAVRTGPYQINNIAVGSAVRIDCSGRTMIKALSQPGTVASWCWSSVRITCSMEAIKGVRNLIDRATE